MSSRSSFAFHIPTAALSGLNLRALTKFSSRILLDAAAEAVDVVDSVDAAVFVSEETADAICAPCPCVISAVVSKLILLGFGTGFFANPTTPSVDDDLGTAELRIAPFCNAREVAGAPETPMLPAETALESPVVITPPMMETFS